MLVLLPDWPELEPLAAGGVVLPEVLLWPEVLPELAPLAASFMHFSFSMPIRCAHFVSLAPAAALPLAPVVVEVLDWPLVEAPELGLSLLLSLLVLAPAPAEPLVEVDGAVCVLVLPEALELAGVCALVLPEALELAGVCALVLPLAAGVDGVVVCELVLLPAAAEPLVEVDGVACELVLPLAAGVDGVALCELVLPLAAPRSRRQRSFSAGIMFSQLLLAMPAVPAGPLVCAPALPGEVCAKEALDSARSAAAVALASTFNFIWMLLSRKRLVGIAARNTQGPCRSTRRA